MARSENPIRLRTEFSFLRIRFQQFLENQISRVENTLQELVRKIEEIHGLDIDGDGKVG